MDENAKIQDGDRLVIGARAIAAEVFNGELEPRQVYREIRQPDYEAFKVAGKHAVFFQVARAALRRRGQKKREAAG
jgi:hypothetical protein